jgi:hypothetical protein
MPRQILDLALLIIFISILVVVFIDRVLPLRIDAERVHIESTVGALRSALGIHIAATVVKQGSSGFNQLENQNPFSLIDPATLPSNYLGELEDPDPNTLGQGVWYFNTATGRLVYIVNFSDHVSTELTEPKRLQFAFKLDYEDMDNNGKFNPGVDNLTALQFKSLTPYDWHYDSE